MHREKVLPYLETADAYRRPRPPVRYARLELDDATLIEALRVARAEGGRNTEQRELLRLWGIWREAVLNVEARAASTILFLLRVAYRFQVLGHEEEAYRVLLFVCDEFRFHISEAPSDDIERQHIAARYAARRDVLSLELLYEGKVPRQLKRDDFGPQQINLREVLR